MTARTPGLVIGLLAGVFLFAGCLNIHAPQTVTVGGNGKGEVKKIRKVDAVAIAERVAREHGQNPENFEMVDQKIDGGWWICFDHKINGYKLGWPYHFAVRVTLDGKSTLYKNR